MSLIKLELLIEGLTNDELDNQPEKVEAALRKAGIQGQVSDVIDREEDDED